MTLFTKKLLWLFGVFVLWYIAMILSSTASADGSGLIFSSPIDKSAMTQRTISITDLSISGGWNPTIRVNLYVDSGSLAFNTSSGLTFDGGISVGKNLRFDGALDDINTALATLKYTAPSTTGTYKLEAFINDDGSGAVVIWGGNWHAYKVVSASLSWTGAKAAAESQIFGGVSGYLATITSQGEHDFILARINQAWWIGGSDIDAEGIWNWVAWPEAGTQFWSGSTIGMGGSVISGQFANRGSTEPNNQDDEDCAQIAFQGGPGGGNYGKWNDLNCASNNARYVVEFGSSGSLPQVTTTSFNITVEEVDPFARCTINSGDINIPYSECVSLAYLYTETDGNHWDTADGWFTDTDVSAWKNYYCDGFEELDVDFDNYLCNILFTWGASVALSGDAGDGKLHVYGLNLNDNNLNGSILSWFLWLPELTYLHMDENNGLLNADFSANTKLYYLDIGDIDSVWYLNLSNNPNLRYLEADSMRLAEWWLTLHPNAITNLIYLDIEDNGFETFDFSDYTNLKFLLIPENSFTTIDISSNTALRLIDVESNELEQLVTNYNTFLEEIKASYNSLTSIDVSNNLLLSRLELEYNELTWLDLSMLDFDKPRVRIYLSSNQLTTLDLPVYSNSYPNLSIQTEYNRLCTVSNNTESMLNMYDDENWREDQYSECPPQNAEAIGGNTVVNLSWEAPFSGNEYNMPCYQGFESDVSECWGYYSIKTFSGDTEDQIGDTVEVSTGTFAYQVGWLTNDIEYTFEICMRYRSEWSYPICTTVKATPNYTAPAPSSSNWGWSIWWYSNSSSSVSSITSTSTWVDIISTWVDMSIFNTTIDTNICFTPMNKLTVDQGNNVSALFKVAHQMLYSYGLTTIAGTLDFWPTRNITRAEAAKFFVQFAQNVLCKKTIQTYDNRFVDIDTIHPDLQANIKLSYEYGIFYGSEGGKFNPNAYISNDELAAVIIRLVTGKYNDAEWKNRAANYINTLESHTSIDLTNTTRGKLAEVLYDLYKNNNYSLEESWYVME